MKNNTLAIPLTNLFAPICFQTTTGESAMLLPSKTSPWEGVYDNAMRSHHLSPAFADLSEAHEGVRLTLDVSYDLNARLEQLAKDNASTTSDILLKAFTLFDLVADATRQKNRVAILDQDKNLLTEIVGI